VEQVFNLFMPERFVNKRFNASKRQTAQVENLCHFLLVFCRLLLAGTLFTVAS
jgi:hypothetical protein